LEEPNITTTKTGSLDALIVMYIDIWQRIAENQRKKKRLENVTNMTKWDIL